MAYCRFNAEDSDTYVILNIWGTLECIACRITPVDNWFGTFTSQSRKEMLVHLSEHRKQGVKVPNRTFERLVKEIIREGDYTV